MEGVVELRRVVRACPDRRRAKAASHSRGQLAAARAKSSRGRGWAAPARRSRPRSGSARGRDRRACSRVMTGTRTERLGSASSACSDTSRPSASRTGMVLVCSVSASSWMRSDRAGVEHAVDQRAAQFGIDAVMQRLAADRRQRAARAHATDLRTHAVATRALRYGHSIGTESARCAGVCEIL